MADKRSDSARGRTDGTPLTNPDTGHTVVPSTEAVEKKFRDRGYKAAGSTSTTKTTAKKTTRKSAAKKAS